MSIFIEQEKQSKLTKHNRYQIKHDGDDRLTVHFAKKNEKKIEEKALPTLQQLCRGYKTITYNQVAEEAGVLLTIEYLIEIGGLVREEHAIKVLQIFSRTVGCQYILEKVAVNIKK